MVCLFCGMHDFAMEIILLLEITNLILEKEGVPSNFRKTLIKLLFKIGDRSECGNYRGISLVSLGSKLLSIAILFRLIISFKRRTIWFWEEESMCRPYFHS